MIIYFNWLKSFGKFGLKAGLIVSGIVTLVVIIIMVYAQNDWEYALVCGGGFGFFVMLIFLIGKFMEIIGDFIENFHIHKH
jgi:hypothetical protein